MQWFDAQLQQIWEKHLTELLHSVATAKIPFTSEIQQAFKESYVSLPQANISLLLQFLLELQKYCQFIFDLALERMEDIEAIEWPNGAELVARHDQYIELQQQGYSNKKLIKKMYDDLPPDSRPEWEKFYGNMRKWIHYHSKKRSMSKEPVKYRDPAVDKWKYTHINNTLSIPEYLKKIFKHDTYASRVLYPICIKIEQEKNQPISIRNTYIFVGYLSVCILHYINESNGMFNEHKELLYELGRIRSIIDPKHAEILNCITNDKAMSDTQKRLSELLRPSEKRKKILSHIPINNFFRDFKNAQNANTSRQIKNWEQVLSLLRRYRPKYTKDDLRILISIFKICKNRKKSLNEIKYIAKKELYEDLLSQVFFDTLYHKLDPQAKIRQLQGLEWHQVPLPPIVANEARRMNSPTTSFSPYHEPGRKSRSKKILNKKPMPKKRHAKRHPKEKADDLVS